MRPQYAYKCTIFNIVDHLFYKEDAIMLMGKDAVKNHPKCGVAPQHLEAIVMAARKKNVVIGLRSVSPYAKRWIERGFPSKSFVIKNKTGRVGPCQGLIAMQPDMGRTLESPSPLKQSSSKDDMSDTTSESSIDSKETTYLNQLQYALDHDPDLQEIPLIMQFDDLMALRDMKVTSNKNSPQNFKLTWDENGQIKVAEARFDGEKYHICDTQGQPIMVLGKTIYTDQGIEILPVTADYDLLVVCPTYRDLEPGKGQSDHTPLRTRTLSSMNLKSSSGNLSRSSTDSPSLLTESIDSFDETESIDSFDDNNSLTEEVKNRDEPKEDPMGGNWSDRIRSVVHTANAMVADLDPSRQIEGLEMFHHNAEFTNPFASELAGSLPSVIVFPHAMDLSGLAGSSHTEVDCVMVETIQELNQLRDYLQDHGFFWPANYNLKEEVPVFRPSKISPIKDLVRKQSMHKQVIQELRQQHSQDDNKNDIKDNHSTQNIPNSSK